MKDRGEPVAEVNRSLLGAFISFLSPEQKERTEEDQKFEKAWQISPQRATARRNSLLVLGFGLVLSVVVVIATFASSGTYIPDYLLWVFTAYIAILVAMTVSAYILQEKKRQFRVEYALQQVAAENTEQDSVELAALWKANKSQLGHYHQIVVSHAESSKRSTRWFLIVGFLFVLGAGALTLLSTRLETAIGTTVIAAAATALTGFVAKAVLRNAATASSELQMFFNHPLEVERALAAERLVEAFETPARRDEARLLIIQSLTRERQQLKAAPSDFIGSTPEPPSQSAESK